MRQRQAAETKDRIVAAARQLMTERGFDGTTIAQIASIAGTSAPTVYAAFGSKRGILVELMNRARFGAAYQDLVRDSGATDPVERLRKVAAITRRIYDGESAEAQLLHGVGAVAPDLAALGQEQETTRYDSQARAVEALSASGKLRPDLSVEAVRDILWTLTSRDTYRMLVAVRGWSSEAYEAWLADLLVSALLAD
ncbi:TetR/AcrR family transcriptional regulator [Nocardia sp. CA-119907]|uniref:TetR/AcrR family transcriptional regulator n=1 Tax=Nocardia sp. CA-119907 TaxID=3239973 RepID=UPI003D96368A